MLGHVTLSLSLPASRQWVGGWRSVLVMGKLSGYAATASLQSWPLTRMTASQRLGLGCDRLPCELASLEKAHRVLLV
jgi:hypothetical protein